MTTREYTRICKQAGCGEKFIVSAPSVEEDRLIGFSEPEYCPKHRAMHARSYSRIACHHFEIELTPEGDQLVRLVEQNKIAETRNTEEFEGRTFDPWNMPDYGYGPGGLGRFQRPLRAFVENNKFQPQERKFQIAEKREEILAALEDHQVLILVGTTGSGKSTYVPWMLLTDGQPGGLSKWARRGPICVTQPRIQATRQVPRFIANSLNGTSLGVGAQIGFTHSNAEEYDRRTRLIFMTDGKLINDIVSGRVGNYSIVMIDEAHERSVNIELILGLLRDQLYLYPHLRVIIASATIDFGAFLTYFYPHLADVAEEFKTVDLSNYNYFDWNRRVPFVYSKGRRFPISEHFWGEPDLPYTKDGRPRELMPEWWKKINNGQIPNRDQLPNAIAELVQLLCKTLDELPPELEDEDGHILVFLPGSREIDKTVSLIQALNLDNVVALPLYATRPLDEQDEALDPKPDKHPKVYGKRRVVVSTNVAETSLTVEGVKHVIDSGYVKVSYWNPKLKVSELQTIPHSQAGCQQRWGRAGRISSGHAYMLYTKKQFEDYFPHHSTPEIARASLEDVILTAKAAGVRTIKEDNKFYLDFEWMPLANEQDHERFLDEIERAHHALVDQKAVDVEHGDLTRYGLELRGMPAEMDVARIFTEGERHALGIEVATLLPFLNSDYGVQTVLKWEQNWNAYTKLAIRYNHLDLVYGCNDDLELFLKLWTLWDTLTEEQRQEWEDVGGINHKNFHEKIELERRKLLEMAIDWRKAENRPVAIEKIDALRALIASCLQDEIYQPLEIAIATEHDQTAGRLQAPPVLSWELGWEGGEVYEEYDDEFSIDPSYAVQASSRSGIYRRYYKKLQDTENSSIELAPISVCFRREDAKLVVVCRRRANYIRPARTKILGMNLIRLEPDWLTAIKGSLVQRCLLYASLSHQKAPTIHQQAKLRLFLPWLMPRGSRVIGAVSSWDPDQGAQLEFIVALSQPRKVWQAAILGNGMGKTINAVESTRETSDSNDDEVTVFGWLPANQIDGNLSESIEIGSNLEVKVRDFDIDEAGYPFIHLERIQSKSDAFRLFARRYHNSVGETIQVEMMKIVEDPLGRNPMFIVRELKTGLEIPMADSDFCGHTHPQPYFGRRFADIDEPFDVDIENIDESSGQVVLSRGRQLLREYGRIPVEDFKIVELPALKVDPLGVYLILAGTGGGSPYVGFVRRSLWPAGFNPQPGDRIPARLRRSDRHVNIKKMEDQLDQGLFLPDELDLGVNLDLRTPPAYALFREHYQVGQPIEAEIEKLLDNGGLLVGLDFELKAMIFESELGFNEDGQIKKARDLSPSTIIDVRITAMFDDTATIWCSISRLSPLPILQKGQRLIATVAMVREDRRQKNKFWLTCCFDKQYPIQVQVELGPDDDPLTVGEHIEVVVEYFNRDKNSVVGQLTKRDVEYDQP